MVDNRLRILLLAPYAPPQNTAEAIQVRRFLAALDGQASGTLVTLPAEKNGWARQDASLALACAHFNRCELRLPLHRFSARVLMSRYLARLHVPDALWWITGQARSLAAHIATAGERPQLIYSRSAPMSAAVLTQRLKETLGLPWLMHLSDPWADSPYKSFDPRDAALEAQCFRAADGISLTTAIQADFYRSKYPACAHKIFVCPNVMPGDAEIAEALANAAPLPPRDAKLNLVFTGNLYGMRSPSPLVEAVRLLQARDAQLAQKLAIHFYGNIDPKLHEMLHAIHPIAQHHGTVSYATALALTQRADAAMTIEPMGDHPLLTGTLLSKATDCLALGTPMLAITEPGSETARLCAAGYGWAAAPSQPQHLAAHIADLLAAPPTPPNPPAAPEAYRIDRVAADLLARMHALCTAGGTA